MKKILAMVAVCLTSWCASTIGAEASLGQVTGVVQTDAYDSTATVEWNEVVGCDGYVTEYSTDGVNWVESGTCYSNDDFLTGLNAGSSYYFRVAAYTKEYEDYEYVYEYGPYSQPIEIVTRVTGNLNNLKFVPTTSDVTVSWDAVAGANCYVITASVDGTEQTFVGAGTSIVLSNMTADAEYTIKVMAIRVSKEGFYVDSWASANLYSVGLLPQAVQSVKQTDASMRYCTIAWTAVPGADKYLVEISSDKVNWTSAENVYSATATIDMPAGSTRWVRVKPYLTASDSDNSNLVYYGAASAILEVVSDPAGTLGALKQTSCTKDSVKVTWDAVAGANCYFVAWADENGNAKSQTITANSITIKNLPSHSKCAVSVTAIRKTSDGSFLASDAIAKDGVFYTIPAKVRQVTVDGYYRTSGSVYVKHEELANAAGYQMEIWTAHKKKDTKIVSATDSYGTINATNKNLKKYNMVKVRVRAYVNVNGSSKKYGAWSDWCYACPQPTMKSIKYAKGGGLSLTWSKVNGAEKYAVYASTKKDSGYKKVTTVSGTSCKVKNIAKKKLQKGKTYYFYVVPLNKVGKKYVQVVATGSKSCWYGTYNR